MSIVVEPLFNITLDFIYIKHIQNYKGVQYLYSTVYLICKYISVLDFFELSNNLRIKRIIGTQYIHLLI
jgi:hypothetical protein